MLYVAGDSFWSSRRSLLWREIVGLCRLRGCRCGHLPRHQFVAPVDRMPVGDPGQDVLEVGLWVQTVELGRDDKRVEGCRPLAAAVRSDKKIVLPPKRDFPHRVLGDVVDSLEPSVGDEAHQRLTPLEDVAERLGKCRLGRQLDHGRLGPDEEGLEQQRRLLTVFNPLGGRGKSGLVLDDIDRGDAVERLLGDWRLRLRPHVEEPEPRVFSDGEATVTQDTSMGSTKGWTIPLMVRQPGRDRPWTKSCVWSGSTV